MTTSRFPIINTGAAYEEMRDRIGGASNTTRLIACMVCGKPMWRNTLGGHMACIGIAGEARPAQPTLPPPIIGNVYATRLPDQLEGQVSDRTAAANEAVARATVAGMARCGECGRPMTCGQRGTHTSCKPDTDQQGAMSHE